MVTGTANTVIVRAKFSRRLNAAKFQNVKTSRGVFAFLFINKLARLVRAEASTTNVIF